MAALVSLQKLVETQQRIVVKLCATFPDSNSNESSVTKFTASTTTPLGTGPSITMLAASSTATQGAGSLAITKIIGHVATSVTQSGILPSPLVSLWWHGATTALIATLSDGYTCYDFNSQMGCAVPDNSLSGTSALLINTAGMQTGSAYTILIELKKHGFAY